MKKIIALAVAGAFVAPAFAADITIGGSVGYIFANSDDTATSVSNLDANNIAVTATDELANGMTVTGTFNLESDQAVTTDDGSNLKISGAFGSIAMGDVAGAADSVGDYTDVAASYGGFDGDGVDAAVLLTVSPIENLTVNISHTPNTVSNVAQASSIQADTNGYSLKYAFPNGEVYYATETYSGEADELNMTAAGIKYSLSGFTVAYEQASEEMGTGTEAIWAGTTGLTANGDDLDLTGVSVTYSMGDITLAAENQKQEQGSTKKEDTTTMSATYAMGPLSVSVSMSEEDVAATDSTALKFAYSF